MAFDTVVDKTQLESALTASADAIRGKTGRTEPIAWLPDKGFAEAISAIETGGGSADEDWFNDGNTHVWISLQEGRTSPMLGVCPNGTVTVDWGDGTTPDVLTGTSTSTVKWTPTHNYASAGDYVITLTVDGEMGFYGRAETNEYSGILRYSTEADPRNKVYQNAVQKVEIGNKVTSISGNAFLRCYSLASVVIPEGVTSIGSNAFSYCYSLASVVIPEGVTSIGGNAFSQCYSLASVVIPEGVTSINTYAFSQCYSLASVVIPEGVTSVGTYAFMNCTALASVVIPEGVTSIGRSAFSDCSGVRYFDFTYCTAVPSLSNANVFNGLAADCEILVPASLYDEWITATNWTTYASYIKAV